MSDRNNRYLNSVSYDRFCKKYKYPIRGTYLINCKHSTEFP